MNKVDAAIKERRQQSMEIVYAREQGRCILCNNAGQEFHEITQRSHYPKKHQVEAGIFEPENMALLCLRCHQNYGNTKWGELTFRELLFLRYDIGERQSLVW